MRLPLFSALLACALASPAFAVDAQNTRLLSDPALSADRLAFSYANDLYTAKLDGSEVRRLTAHPGVDAGPKFSPDGQLIAFTGRYDGNTDVFVIPATGGAPRRLTFHPGADTALGFTPDGKAVLFSSQAEVYTNRYLHLFTVPVEGGIPTRLPIPHAAKAVMSPDGKTIAYLPVAEAMNQWKHYRGGTTATLVLFDTKTYATEKVPQPAGRCNDTDPAWLDGKLYFRSDRDGEFNLYVFDPATKAVSRLTQHKDFPVLALSTAAGRVLYEQAGTLHLYDVASAKTTDLRIGVPADLVETRPRFVKASKWVRSASISPSGARAVFELRGDIVTVPREKGDDRNLTNSPGVHDRAPVWSPDGKQIAWFTEVGGEYQLRVAPQDGQGEAKNHGLKGSGFYESPAWSPDGKKIAYTDNSRAVWIIDLASGQQTKVDADFVYGPVKVLHHTWSPDSQWLAYTRNTATFMNQIWLYSVKEAKSFPLSDGLADARHPAFDANGKYLYFIVSTDAGPVQDWFAQSNADMAASSSIYAVALAKGTKSPIARQSDEEGEGEKKDGDKKDEKPTEKKDDKAADKGKDGKEKSEAKDGKDKEKEKTPPAVVIDHDGLAERIVALPLKPAGYSDLTAAGAGVILYRKEAGAVRGGDSALCKYDFEKRKEDTLAEGVGGFEYAEKGKKVLVRVKDAWSICDLGDKLDLSKHRLRLDDIQLRIDPVAEWAQIFHEAWRINRDYFYDPGMHGADWKAMREKYAAFLPDLATRRDLNRLIQWMCSELAVGHHRVGGGDSLADTESVPGGLLGADFTIENGRYRIKRILGGLNWNPDLRSPLTEPGVEVKVGEYVLAIEGVPLRAPESIHARLERKANRTVELEVGPNADGSKSRRVKVVPIENEQPLRHRDWVEGNLRKVTEATKGRVAYVYVPDTADLGHTYFKRYFYPQANREGIIVDERHNGGGSVADYYIDILRRPVSSYWTMRYGATLKTPIAGIHGPKAMLADETAGSGGDLLPWMFKQFKLGPVIGTRTWGGLVGILGFPVLLDGGFVMAPDIGFWTEEEGYGVESVGVPPDIEVEQTPAEVIAGKDPQLERAIAEVMKALEANPPKTPKRPPFPTRARPPWAK